MTIPHESQHQDFLGLMTRLRDASITAGEAGEDQRERGEGEGSAGLRRGLVRFLMGDEL